MEISHRVAIREDLSQIVEIYNATFTSRMATADTEPVSVESRVLWFDEHLPALRPLWVCEETGCIQALLSFSSFYGRPAYSKTAEISVYVRETCRRCGLVAYLLHNAVTYAPQINVETLLGFIFGHNVPSLLLFEGAGFARWGTLPKVATLDATERDLVIVGRRV